MPDISCVADPFTGAEFICDGGSCFDAPGTGPQFSVVGGTSLSCPIFSALWAIANQGAGSRLGQAARMLYTLPAGAITDIVAVSSEDNARGSISPRAGAGTMRRASGRRTARRSWMRSLRQLRIRMTERAA